MTTSKKLPSRYKSTLMVSGGLALLALCCISLPGKYNIFSSKAHAVTNAACDGSDGVYLYVDASYGGTCSRFTSDSALPFTWAVGNDTVSSVKIIGAYQTAVYVDGYCQGGVTTLTSNDPDLSDNEVTDNNVSSLRVAAAGATMATGFCSDNGQYNVMGGLFAVDWDGLSAGYKSLEVDMQPLVNDTDNYFFATQGYFKNCSGPDCGFYAGMQTYGSLQKKKIAIFSVWGGLSGTPGAGGNGNPFSGEGSGYSVSVPYAWVLGHNYRTRIYTTQQRNPISQWTATITDLNTNRTTTIGTIRTAADNRHNLINDPINFHERYAGPDATCPTVPVSKVKFSNATANTGSIKSPSWTSDNYNGIMSQAECQNYIWHQNDYNGVSSNVGIIRPSNIPYVQTSYGTRTTPPKK